MQIMLATSRSINKDRFYQSEQDKRQEIHLQKIKNISQTPLQPIKIDTTFEKNLKKAKSVSKIFEQEENKLIRRLQNNSLLNRIINVQPTIKTLRINKTLSKQKLITTSSNWTARKKQSEKIEKQHQIFIKRCETISAINVKDVKKKMQEEIREYLELKNSIRKIKPSTATYSGSKLRDNLSKKVSMGLPLWDDSIKTKEDLNNLEEKLESNSQKQIPKKILLENLIAKS